jgi:adenosylcobinamide-GDP ribazoletransferase
MKWTFPLALTFLSIIPWPRLPLAGAQDLARSMFWFPWVGLILGLGYFGIWLGLGWLFPAPAAAGLFLACTVLATRGLHLDGLADTVDGLGGGQTPEARLCIMKDSRLGAFGGVALIVVLLAKFAFLLSLAYSRSGWGVLVFPILSRWGMVLLAYASPYARPEGGLGEAMTTGVSGKTLVGATLSAGGLTVAAAGPRGLLLLAGAAMVVFALRRLFRKKLGGITGDTLGACNEILEALLLAGVLLLT